MQRAGVSLVIFLIMFGTAPAASGMSPDVAYREFRTFEISDRPDKPIKSKVTIELTCLTERSTRDQAFVVGDGTGEEVDDIKARVNGKEIDKRYIAAFQPKLRDVFFFDLRMWGLRFPESVRVGDTISYEYKKTFDTPARLELLYVPNRDYIDRYQVTFKHDRDVVVSIEWHFPGDSIPMVIDTIDDEHFVLTIDSVRKRPSLVLHDHEDDLAMGLISVQTGGMHFTPTSPEAYGRWYLNQMTYPMSLDSTAEPELQRQIDSAESDLAAVEIIHDFVRSSFRYVADHAPPHAILPHPPNEVLVNRYGDCKDRAFLVKALAERAGLQVFPCLVSRSHTREFSGLHSTLFNHVVCAVETDGGLLFFDPTPGNYAMGTLPPQIIGTYALVLDPDSFRVAEVWPRDTLPVYDMRLVAGIDSLQSGRAEILLRAGYRAEVIDARGEMNDYEFQRFLTARIPRFLARIGFENFTLSERDKWTVMLTCETDLTAFVVPSPSSVYLPRNPFITVSSSVLEREADSWPMLTGIPRRYAVRLELEAPDYRASQDSLRLTADGLAGMSSDLQPADSGRFVINYEYYLKAVRAAGAEKQTYLDFCRESLDSKRQMYKLEGGGDR